MVKLVTFTDAGDKPVYVNPVFVTFVERPAVGVFGHTTIHFGGDQLTVKEEPEAVVQALAQSNLAARQAEASPPPRVEAPVEPGSVSPPDVIALPEEPAPFS